MPRGSYLVIENLDRLSREDERTALRLWLDILDAGINSVQKGTSFSQWLSGT